MTDHMSTFTESLADLAVTLIRSWSTMRTNPDLGASLEEYGYTLCGIRSVSDAALSSAWKRLNEEMPNREVRCVIAVGCVRSEGSFSSSEIAQLLDQNISPERILEIHGVLQDRSDAMTRELFRRKEIKAVDFDPYCGHSITERVQQLMEWCSLPQLSDPHLIAAWLDVAITAAATGLVVLPKEVAKVEDLHTTAGLIRTVRPVQPTTFMELTVMPMIRDGMTPEIAISYLEGFQ